MNIIKAFLDFKNRKKYKEYAAKIVCPSCLNKDLVIEEIEDCKTIFLSCSKCLIMTEWCIEKDSRELIEWYSPFNAVQQKPPCNCSTPGCSNYIDIHDLYGRVGINNTNVVCSQCYMELEKQTEDEEE